MTEEQQIKMLNIVVRTKLAPSEVHGIGVFALNDIPKGTKLYTTMYPQPFKISPDNLNGLYPEVREYLMSKWSRMVNGEAFMCPDTNFQAYMNHSNKPNYDNKTDLTTKLIKAGEEVFEDYRNIEGWAKVFKFIK